MRYTRWAALAVIAILFAAGCGGDGGGGAGKAGTLIDDFAYGAASGASVYAVGYTEGSLNGQPHSGFADIAIVKFNSSKGREWTRQQGTSTPDKAYAAATDASGNVYAAGSTYGGLDGNINQGFDDAVLVKYSPEGVKLWSQQIGTSENDYAYGAATDTEGNAYITGHTEGGIDGNAYSGDSDMFLVKYDSSGARLWSAQLGSPAYDDGRAAATDASGNVYVAGFTWGYLDGGSLSGAADIFVVKYSSAGLKLWSRQFGSGAIDIAQSIAVDSAGNVYVSGHTEGNLDGIPNAGKADAFIIKYDSSGARLWSRLLGTAAEDMARGVAIDASGNVYVAGYTFGGLDGNTNAGAADVFLSRFASDGSKLWTAQIGSAGYDFCYAVAVDGEGFIFPVGATNGDLDGKANEGLFDIFILKYDSNKLKL
jgi:hypothetical protein